MKQRYKCISKLTPNERKRGLRKEMFRKVREMEMERQIRTVLEELQQHRTEKEGRCKETEKLQRQKGRTEEGAL